MGVQLGDRLMPPRSGENEKGFYEDLDLYDLNVRMLKAIGKDWDSLAPITPEDTATLRDKGFLISALDLLRQKSAAHRVFGFKDPRVAKLLPFWEQIFQAGAFKVSYVIVIRNPLSVAHSLRKREGFSRERTYALWMTHVISSLTNTARKNRVLIDFDLFLRSPEQQLARMARSLALRVNATAMTEYLSEFLDGKLRHYNFSMDELLADDACTPLLRETYTTALEYATDGRSLDSPAFYELTSRWNAELSCIQQSFVWIERLLKQASDLQRDVDIRDQQLRNIIQHTVAKDSRVFASVFDSNWYLQRHPDVAAAGIDAYQHYLDAGLAEGRAAAPDMAAFIRDGFASYSADLRNRLNRAIELTEAQAERMTELNTELTGRLQKQKQDHEQQNRERENLFSLKEQSYEDKISQLEKMLKAEEEERRIQDKRHAEYVEAQQTLLTDARRMIDSQMLERITREQEWSTRLVELQAAHNIQMQQQSDQSERRELLAQMRSLQRMVDQAFGELDVLRGEKVALKEIIEENETASAKSEKELTVLTQAVSQKECEIEALKNDNKLLTELSVGKDSHILSLQEAVAAGERTIAQLQNQQGAQEARLAELSEHLASLSANQDAATPSANSVDELLQHQAEQFVDCAYKTLLRRSPDQQGRQFYLARVLSGTPKLQVLKEISESEEARKIGVRLPGLPELLNRYRLAKNPLRRFFFPSLAVVDRDSADQNRLRAIEQKLFVDSRRPLRGMVTRLVNHDARSLNKMPYRTPDPGRAEVATVAPSLAQLSSRSATPPADGIWEWAEYEAVKERIAGVKRSRAASFVAKPIELFDIGDRPFSSVLHEITLPHPGNAPDVSIILPVFNNLKLTLECLLSISRYADPSVTFEVLVRDDASTDDTVNVITAIKNLRLVRNPENLGFLRNCNRAIDSVRGRYVVFLNNDVQVSKGWLGILLSTFSKFERVGAVGPRYVYPNGHLQEVGAAFRPDATAQMIGLGEDPEQLRFTYARRVDYTSGACLMLPTALLKELDGFSEEFLPCYCEDSDLCLRVQELGYFVYCNPEVTIVHHLSKTTAALNDDFKFRCVAKNLNTLAQKWARRLETTSVPRVLAFYLPQFHPFPENNLWWGQGFTEWTNVTKAQPNFEGHYQPRYPADLGYYDLRLPEIMAQQADLARRHGIDGFCFYYYWFGGKRLLEAPIEAMLSSKLPDFPFCLCWANENWSRRWDGKDSEILMSQRHSPDDDIAVIGDLVRFFQDPRYIRVDGRPLMLIYRVQLFPNFAETAERWRVHCREIGVGEIYLAMVESFELVHSRTNPSVYGCDAAVEFPPQELAEPRPPSGALINPAFAGSVADFRDLAVRFATRDLPNYKRFLGVAPGWDNTARMQDRSFCFEHATPGAFQAWLEEAIELTRTQYYGDERLIFVNAWNEWAEGAYLEPDRRFGHAFLEAVRNAKQAAFLLRRHAYGLGA